MIHSRFADTRSDSVAGCLPRFKVWSDRLDFMTSLENMSPIQLAQLSPVHQSQAHYPISWKSFLSTDTDGSVLESVY